MPNSSDARSDLAVLTWQWLEEEYARLCSRPGDALLQGRCQAHARTLSYLLSIDKDEVLRRVRDRRARRL